MNDKPDKLAQPPERLSLKRWSRRKLEAARIGTAPSRELAPAPIATAPQPQKTEQAAAGALQSGTAPLPPIESLTIDSEFAAFFKPEIPEATKRAALKQLFRDPRFNIMDGLDVYIDDYTQPDPIPAEMMEQLLHTRHIFDPPATEVNAEGHVVDKVVEPAPESVAALAAAPAPATSAAPALSAIENASAGPLQGANRAPDGGSAAAALANPAASVGVHR